MSSLFGFSAPTFYSWKKENRPIILLIQKYFETAELIEFLNTKKIDRLELIRDYSLQELEELIGRKQPIKKGILYLLLENFDRASLVYFLYIFKKEISIKDSSSLYIFIDKNLLMPDSFIAKVSKFLKNLEPTFLSNKNLSFKMNIVQFNKNIKQYLDSSDIDYIFNNKDEYYNIILEIADKKL